MKIFAIGDPHFKKDNLHFMQWATQEILEIVKREQPDLCVCLGDTLNDHNRIDMRACHDAVLFFFALADICPLVIIIGNHDRENKTDFLTDMHPFVALKRTPNITIVDKVLRDVKRNFIYVPYVEPGKFREALETIGYYPEEADPDEVPDLIFAHQEFKGSNYGLRKNSISEHGDPWNPKLPLVISGHIHEHQVIPGVVYVGTFLQQNYGENPNKALMMIYLDEKVPITEANLATTSFKPLLTDGTPGSEPLPILGTLMPTAGVLTVNQQISERNSRIRIQRIPLQSICIRKTIAIPLSELPNFSKYLPPDNIRSEEIVYNSETTSQKPNFNKKIGTLIRVEMTVDATEKKALKKNPHFIALEKIVDQVDVIATGDKTNLALAIRDRVITQNKNEQIAKEPTQNPNLSLVDIVKTLLADDPTTYSMFVQEIATGSI